MTLPPRDCDVCYREGVRDGRRYVLLWCVISGIAGIVGTAVGAVWAVVSL